MFAPITVPLLPVCSAEVGDLKDVESEQIVVNFPNPDNLMCCEITIKPGELPDRTSADFLLSAVLPCWLPCSMASCFGCCRLPSVALLRRVPCLLPCPHEALHVAAVSSFGSECSTSATFGNCTDFVLSFFSDDGFWSGGAFKFTMTMPKTYPHDAPKVHCDTKVCAPATCARTGGAATLTVASRARAGVPSKH